MLRITGGEHRGRRLKVPDVASTRPLVERARQALMDHLRDLIPGATVWDVYAGSGILGFEALSRGAALVVAVERHPRAAARLRESAAELGMAERLDLRRIDARRFLRDAAPEPALVFFDPPYAAFRGAGRAEVWELFCALAARLGKRGCAVVHTPKGILTLAERERLPGLERRDYGSTSLYWWHEDRAAGAGDGE
ncbi:MAG TPA: RsmD family RNA methyltransferase [Planctomycetota bacterium]